MTELTSQRKGEIAIALIKIEMLKDGVKFHKNNLQRNLGEIAKFTGFPIPELKEFTRQIIQELFNECFSEDKENQGEAQAS